MAPPSIAKEYKELSGVTRVSETILRREVDLKLLHDRLDTHNCPPTQQEQTSYAVYIISEMRELPRGKYALQDNEDFKGWTTQDFNNLPRAIRRELLLALAEHGQYPVGKANRTQAEKLADVINERSTEGPLRERRKGAGTQAAN